MGLERLKFATKCLFAATRLLSLVFLPASGLRSLGLAICLDGYLPNSVFNHDGCRGIDRGNRILVMDRLLHHFDNVGGPRREPTGH